ncbi:hypothetical protein ACGFZA_08060 [Streptomyces sp. NPDC048211]|uniref:DUF7848 domain-containing protein n=1 Tax=Streptomyces sp. NPDC048211 TaxID=3365516 RepID=UPI00371FD38F
MTTRGLPPVAKLTEQQQRGWACVWCGRSLTVGSDIDLGEQRARPAVGAAYSWFPRACPDTAACSASRGDPVAIRSVIRHADWTIGVDREDGASGPIYEIECTTCLDRSDAAEEKKPAEDWAISHTGRHTDHRGYRAIITSFVRVTPAPGNPLRDRGQDR